MIPYFFIVGIFQLVGHLIAGLDVTNTNVIKTSAQTVVVSFCTLLGTLTAIWIFTKYIDKIEFEFIGFKMKNVIKESVAGLLVGSFSVFLGFIILTLTGRIIPTSFEFNTYEFLLAIFVFINVAISEEVLCRGYILRNLMISSNKYVALIVSALVFALLHCANPDISLIPMISLLLSGLLYGVAYIYNQRLWFPISVHFGWNFLQSILGFNISGNEHYAFMNIENIGEDYITGGNFGFEGSIYSVLIQGIVLIGITIFYERTKYLKARSLE